ncbi:hypothetical protein JTB14_006504 [Gonioctena quinquepunctata]|nr:hypothetical protein JTB14_006504 [Gonioctena quinquepunctata]
MDDKTSISKASSDDPCMFRKMPQLIWTPGTVKEESANGDLESYKRRRKRVEEELNIISPLETAASSSPLGNPTNSLLSISPNYFYQKCPFLNNVYSY